jgi:hypothetical protein
MKGKGFVLLTVRFDWLLGQGLARVHMVHHFSFHAGWLPWI